jgi:hypothetical protein
MASSRFRLESAASKMQSPLLSCLSYPEYRHMRGYSGCILALVARLLQGASVQSTKLAINSFGHVIGGIMMPFLIGI